MEDVMKIVKSLEESALLIKGISETIEDETKRTKGGFLQMFLGTLATKRSNKNKWRGNKSRSKFLMPPHSLTNFETQKYYQNKPTFNGVYSRNNLSKIKDGTYIVNLDEYESVGSYWIALYVNAENVTSFDSFGVEHVLKYIRKFIRNKNITTNIYRIQAYVSIMCKYFCTGFIAFMLKRKSLLEYIYLFYRNEYKRITKWY